MVERKCQAANPETCWMHGNPDPVKYVFNPSKIKNKLSQAYEDNNKEISNFEEFQENRNNLNKIKKVYNATLDGLDVLQKEIYSSQGVERIEKESEYEEAQKYRKEILQKSPFHVQSNKNYVNLTQKFSKKKIIINTTSRKLKTPDHTKLLKELQKIKPGTPLAIETNDGYHLYDTAGNGLIHTANPKSLSTRLFLKPSFAHEDGISLHSTDYGIGFESIKEIHVLDDKAVNVFNTFNENKHTVETSFASPYDVYSIHGDGFFYEVEGNRVKGEWKTKNFSMTLKPWKDSSIKKIV